VRGEVWLAGIPGARETRLTPSKETCRLSKETCRLSKETCRIFYPSRIQGSKRHLIPVPQHWQLRHSQSFFVLQAHDKLTGMSINNVAQIMQKTLALVKPLAEGGGADRQLLKSLQAGLAIKNPPKKTPKKTT
jgi:hypothetical protein